MSVYCEQEDCEFHKNNLEKDDLEQFYECDSGDCITENIGTPFAIKIGKDGKCETYSKRTA